MSPQNALTCIVFLHISSLPSSETAQLLEISLASCPMAVFFHVPRCPSWNPPVPCIPVAVSETNVRYNDHQQQTREVILRVSWGRPQPLMLLKRVPKGTLWPLACGRHYEWILWQKSCGSIMVGVQPSGISLDFWGRLRRQKPTCCGVTRSPRWASSWGVNYQPNFFRFTLVAVLVEGFLPLTVPSQCSRSIMEALAGFTSCTRHGK